MNEKANIAELGLPVSLAARRAATRRTKAAQTREWRDMRRATGIPEARQVDAAIVEAMGFCLQPIFTIKDDAGIHLSLTRAFKTATLILVRDGADRKLAAQAIRERLGPRDAHDRPGHVPNLRAHIKGYNPHQRRGDEEWDDNDRAIMREVATPRRAME